MTLVAALAASGVYAQSAQPAPATPAPSIDQADVFLGICQKPENRDVCTMYLAGYTNGVLVQSLIDKKRPFYCVPQNIGRKEALETITSYMKVLPEHLLEPTGAALYKALIGAFPCK